VCHIAEPQLLCPSSDDEKEGGLDYCEAIRAAIRPLRDYLMVSAHRQKVVPVPLVAGTCRSPTSSGRHKARSRCTRCLSSPEEIYLRRYPVRPLSLGNLRAMVPTRVPKLIIVNETGGSTSSGRDSTKATAAVSNTGSTLLAALALGLTRSVVELDSVFPG
jgi:hypothetical protein